MKGIITVLLLGFLIAGCNSEQTSDNNHNSYGNTNGKIEAAQGTSKTTEETASEGDNMSEIAVFETTEGTFEIELNRAKAPVSVENFMKYVNSGHYDGTIFHRVMKGFMIQGGGFTPDGSQKKTNSPIKLESNNGLKNTLGTVAMARTSDPNSATAQFFVNTANNGFLDYNLNNEGYAVFGKVISGIDVVKKIESSSTTTKGPFENWPVNDVAIKKASMKK